MTVRAQIDGRIAFEAHLGDGPDCGNQNATTWLISEVMVPARTHHSSSPAHHLQQHPADGAWVPEQHPSHREAKGDELDGVLREGHVPLNQQQGRALLSRGRAKHEGGGSYVNHSHLYTPFTLAAVVGGQL